MTRQTRICAALLLLLSGTLAADTLGYVEQKFTSINFEKGKWIRTGQSPCHSYAAQVDGAAVEVLRYSMGNLVPFKAKRGMMITVCGDVAAFDEGFETGQPVPSTAAESTRQR